MQISGSMAQEFSLKSWKLWSSLLIGKECQLWWRIVRMERLYFFPRVQMKQFFRIRIMVRVVFAYVFLLLSYGKVHSSSFLAVWKCLGYIGTNFVKNNDKISAQYVSSVFFMDSFNLLLLFMIQWLLSLQFFLVDLRHCSSLLLCYLHLIRMGKSISAYD